MLNALFALLFFTALGLAILTGWAVAHERARIAITAASVWLGVVVALVAIIASLPDTTK